jgi:hypothetical protein
MSSLGKYLLYFALAGAVVAAIAGYLVIGKYNTEKDNFTEVSHERDSAKLQVTKAKTENDTLTAAKAAVDTELTDTKTKVDDLTAKLTAAQKDSDDAKTAVQTAQAATKDATDKLAQVNVTLGNMTPEAAVAAIKKATDDLTANQSEEKILQDQVQALNTNIEELKKDLTNEKRSYIPPGVTGQITYVNRPWNFVVLNIGLNNGVVPNGELIVYRGKNFLGKIKISSAEETTSVGDILPDTKADIQIGDNVLN